MISVVHKWSQMRWPVATVIGSFRKKKCIKYYESEFHRTVTTSADSKDHAVLKLASQHMLEQSTSSVTAIEKQPGLIAKGLPVLNDDIHAYMSVYPDFIHELTEAAWSNGSDDIAEWFQKSLEYNVPANTKQMCGLVTVLMYKSLVKAEQLTVENYKLAQYLGWCVELLHSFFNISDDMMDKSITRRGQLCWYKLENSKSTISNDVLMMENGIYELLRKHFRHFDCYVPMVELFHEVTFQVTRGQLQDFLTSRRSVDTFNMETYNSIVLDKSTSAMIYLPATLALHLAGVNDPHTFRQCRNILVEMTRLCQVQNDFLDCFGNPDITGKLGTDIESNKCSWLAVTCMQLVNHEQRAIMLECYGQNDPQKIARVRQLYEELNIPSIFAMYEEETCNKLKIDIQHSTNKIPQQVLLNILEFCYQK